MPLAASILIHGGFITLCGPDEGFLDKVCGGSGRKSLTQIDGMMFVGKGGELHKDGSLGIQEFGSLGCLSRSHDMT